MISLDDIKTVIGDVLQIGDRAAALDADSPLLGAIVEFDSMAVVSVLTTIEDQFGVLIDDDEVSAEAFETLGSLTDFVNSLAG